MKKLAKAKILVLLLLLLYPFNLSAVSANDETVGYSVRAIIPENQLNLEVTYFDLRVEPNQKQVINVEILNSSQEDIEIDIHITNPITNSNGLIDYTNVEAKPEESLKIPITEIATVEEKTVSIQAGKSMILPIYLEIPKEEFSGIILGGIYFEKKTDKDEEKNKEGVQITNKYSYVIGLKLKEVDIDVEPALLLTSVKPALVNYRTAVKAKIQNSAPTIVEKLAINGIVYNSKGKEVRRIDVEDYRMAPNSSMDFVIDWKKEELKPGKYTLSLHANSGMRNWDWEEEFTIPKEQAQLLNEKAIDIYKDYSLAIYLGFSLIVLILLGIIVWLVRRNKQLKDNKH